MRININPFTLRDVKRLQEFMEGQSYVQDVHRFRPLLRVQTFIDYRKKYKKLPADIE